MVDEFIESIGKKLEVSITITIFLTIILKAYFEITKNIESANRIFMAYSVFVGFYIISYGLYN